MTALPPTDEEPEAEKPPAPQRPKMTIGEQAAYMGKFRRRFVMHQDQALAGEALITVTKDDMMIIETIWQTLMVMEVHGADRLIRDKIMREKRAGGSK